MWPLESDLAFSVSLLACQSNFQPGNCMYGGSYLPCPRNLPSSFVLKVLNILIDLKC